MILRQGFKEHGLRIILWFTILALGLGFVAQFLRDRTPMRASNDIAIINGKAIDSKLFYQRMQHEQERIAMLRQQLGNQFEQFAHLLGMESIAQRVIENMVQEELLGTAAKKSLLDPNQAYILSKFKDPQFAQQELVSLVPFYVINPQRGTIDPELLSQYLHKFGISIAQFEEMVENLVTSNLLFKLLTSTVYVSPADLQTRYIQQYVPRKYEIINFNIETYRKKVSQLPVTDQELKDFAMSKMKSEGRYIVPEKRSGTVWEFNLDSYGIVPSDKAIEGYYAKHKFSKYVKNPAQVQIRKIVVPATDTTIIDEIKSAVTAKPETFKDFAKKYSQDSETASKGGLMNPFKRGTYDASFEKEAFGLENVGDVAVLETKGSETIIIQLEKKLPTEFVSLAQVKNEIIAALSKERFAERFEMDMKNLMMQAQTNKSAVAEFASSKGASKIEYKNVTIEQDPRLFSKSQRDITYSIQNNQGTLIAVNDITKSYEPTFDTIKEEVKKDWYETQAWTALHKDLDTAFNELQNPLQEVAQKYNARYEKTDWIDPQNQSQLDEMTKRGIDANALTSLTQPESSSEAAGENNGYLIRLSEVKTVDPEAFKEQKNKLNSALTNEKRELVQRGFVASLVRNAKLSYNDTFNN
jgi:parvulin-like peptidyl-prolyl isomerase